MSPLWIALEGGEASGKSTQAERLARRLDAVLTREPGGTPVGERIRELLLDRTELIDDRAEVLLLGADRAQHVASVVEPALSGGRCVVSDRSAFSSLAYQGYGRGLPLDDVRRVSDWASRGRWPDLVVLLDVPDAIRRQRMQRAHDRLEAAGAEFHRRVNDGFRSLASSDPARWVVVDGARPPDDVESSIADAYDRWLAAHR